MLPLKIKGLALCPIGRQGLLVVRDGDAGIVVVVVVVGFLDVCVVSVVARVGCGLQGGFFAGVDKDGGEDVGYAADGADGEVDDCDL